MFSSSLAGRSMLRRRGLPYPTLSFSSSVFRCLSRAGLDATRNVPKTPDGHNPYKVLELDGLTAETTLDEVSAQFKKMAVKYHPDSKGGSNEQMSEINAAHHIIKAHHADVIQAFKENEMLASARPSQRPRSRPDRNQRATKAEEMSKSGGVASEATQQVRDMNQQRWKNAKEIEMEWAKLKDDTKDRIVKMMSRFEIAMEQCAYFKQTRIATDITVRERWLRKTFAKNLWEEVHEMRTELLKRGARNLQQQELAEEMVAFASSTQKKLNDDFSRQAQRQIQTHVRIVLERMIKIGAGCTAFLWIIYRSMTGFWANSFAVSFRPGVLGY